VCLVGEYSILSKKNRKRNMEKELRVQMIHFHNLKKENKDFGFSS